MARNVEFLHTVHFVADIPTATQEYRESWGCEPTLAQSGWVVFEREGERVALHRGKGRKPRFDYEADDLAEAQEEMRGAGWKVGEIKTIRGKLGFQGKDRNGNSLLVREKGASETLEEEGD